MIGLHTLIPPGSGIQLTHGVSINDRGEISGDGVLPTGDYRAFVLIPCDENHQDIEGCDYDAVDAETGAQVSPAQIGEPSAPAGGPKFTPTQMMSRYRSLMGHHKQRLGVLPQE
jgi:hypothetical protein